MNVLQIQDENAAPTASYKARAQGGESRRVFGTPLSAVKPGAGGPKIRKALSNITNSAANAPCNEKERASNGDASAPQKRGSKPLSVSGAHATGKGVRSTLNSGTAVRNISDENWNLAQRYAADGIEHLAGKSARELDEETKLMEQKHIRDRVDKLTSFRPFLSLSGRDSNYKVPVDDCFDHTVFQQVPNIESLKDPEPGVLKNELPIFEPSTYQNDLKEPISDADLNFSVELMPDEETQLVL